MTDKSKGPGAPCQERGPATQQNNSNDNIACSIINNPSICVSREAREVMRIIGKHGGRMSTTDIFRLSPYPEYSTRGILIWLWHRGVLGYSLAGAYYLLVEVP